MIDATRLNRSWYVAGMVFGVFYTCLAWYADWSDRYIHTFLAVCLVLAAAKLPRVATGLLGLAIGLMAIGLLALPSPHWARDIHLGDSMVDIVAKLGEPAYEAASLDEARKLTAGHSSPSSLRFRHRGKIAIYIRGEHILWVGHDGDRVHDFFIGGS